MLIVFSSHEPSELRCRVRIQTETVVLFLAYKQRPSDNVFAGEGESAL